MAVTDVCICVCKQGEREDCHDNAASVDGHVYVCGLRVGLRCVSRIGMRIAYSHCMWYHFLGAFATESRPKEYG